MHQSSFGTEPDKMSNPEDRRPHVCPTCGKAYTIAAHLRDHQRSVHDGVRYICSKCQKLFVKESYRNRHQQQCPGTRYTCSNCGQDFSTVLQLRTHRTNAHQPQAINPHHRSSTSRAEAASVVRPSTSRDEAASAVRPSTSRDEPVARKSSPVAK